MPWTWRNQRLPFRFRSESEGSSPCPQLQLPVMASKDHSVWSKTSACLARPTDLYINIFNLLPTSCATKPPLQGCCQCCHDLKWAPCAMLLPVGMSIPNEGTPISLRWQSLYIVLQYRTQETIQKFMITGPCKFQTHLSWSESLILTSRSRKNHSLCTSLSCQEGEHLFQTGIKVTDSPAICWIYHELPWAPMSHKVGSHRGDEVIWWTNKGFTQWYAPLRIQICDAVCISLC